MYKNIVQENRSRVISDVIPMDDRFAILELGPQAMPTFYKNERNIIYLDYETKEQAQQHFLYNEELFNNVQEPDYIVTTDEYYTVIDDRFDMCIANHVIEHTDDIILWLNSLGRMLNDDGYLFLSIPDKKHTFDKYRANTTVSHIITDFFKGGKWSEMEHVIEIMLLYDKAFVDKPFEIAANLKEGQLRKQAARTAWTGLHRHVFEMETFRHQIMEPILYAGLADFAVVHCSETLQPGNEFHCVLRKGRQETFDQDKFLKGAA